MQSVDGAAITIFLSKANELCDSKARIFKSVCTPLQSAVPVTACMMPENSTIPHNVS